MTAALGKWSRRVGGGGFYSLRYRKQERKDGTVGCLLAEWTELHQVGLGSAEESWSLLERETYEILMLVIGNYPRVNPFPLD